jgi:outer membrane lipoprotein SlyB
MVSSFPKTDSSQLWKKLVGLGTTVAVLGWSGCSSVAPSTTAKSAAVGTAIGAGTGAIVGNNSSVGSSTGILGGAALGALAGGIVGMVQEAKDRKEQDRLSQERAYQQERAKRLSEEAKAKAAQDEQLAIAQGFRISDMELNEAQKKTDETAERLKKLKEEKANALARKKTLDELHEKQLSNEAEAAQLEEELARLKGEDTGVKVGSPNLIGRTSGSPTTSAVPAATPPKPGM